MNVETLRASIEKLGHQPTVGEIEAWEAGLCLRLPLAFKRLLLQVNGGHVGSLLLVDIPGLEGPADLHGLYGVNHHDPGYDLASAIEVLAGKLPKNAVPIGFDSLGSRFCIVTSGETVGAVYYWDWTTHNTSDENFHLISKTIEAFLGSIRAATDEES